MGKGPEWTVASSIEDNWLGPCQAHHVGISPQEDRGGPNGEMGEGEDATTESLTLWGSGVVDRGTKWPMWLLT